MCTTFVLKNNSTSILAKSYDFYYGHGLIFTNKRNVFKKSLVKDTLRSIEWVSKFGSITFNQFGRELPQCGINEKGLAVAQMNLLDSKIIDTGKKMINELQWMQYQLDNYSSVAEVVKHIKDLSIGVVFLPLHYTTNDANGDFALIEFIDDQIKIYLNPPIPVLTNNTYDESLEYCKKFTATNQPQSMHPLDRFVRTYYSVQEFQSTQQNDPIMYAFSTLDKVKSSLSFQSLWNYIVKRIPPSASYWNVVFDCKNLIVYFRTLNSQNIRSFNLKSFDYSCVTPVMMCDINKVISGKFNDQFSEYTANENNHLIDKSFAPVKNTFSNEIIDQIKTYPESCRCKY